MHLAARAGALDVLEVLLEDLEKADRLEYVNAADKSGMTPVFLAKQRGLLPSLMCCMHGLLHALFNPETSILIQKHRPYIGNLNSETPGDSKKAFLHWGDYLGLLRGHFIQAGLWEHH